MTIWRTDFTRTDSIRPVGMGLVLAVIVGILSGGSLEAQDHNYDNWDLVVDPSFKRNPDRQVLRSFRVPESSEAEQLIHRAGENMKVRNHAAAAADLFEVVTLYGDKVFQAGRESVRGLGRSCARFVGAAELARYLLSRMPEEGRKAWEAYAGKKTLDDFREAKANFDLPRMEKIARTWSSASFGLRALRFMGDYYLERGEPGLAELYLKKQILYSGRIGEAVEARLARTRPNESSGSGRRPLSELRWSTMGGANDRNRPMPFLAGASFSPLTWEGSLFGESMRDENPFREMGGCRLPFRLVREGDLLVVNDSVSVKAFSIYSGERLWEFPGPLAGDLDAVSFFKLREYTDRAYRRQAGTISGRIIAGGTVHNGVLLTNLQSARPRRKQKRLYRDVINKPIPVRSLYAFSLDEGRLLWKQGGGGFDSFLNRLSISTPPAVTGNRVFCEGCLIEGGIRCFLLCFDLNTGDLLWKTPIGVGQQELTMFNMNFKEFTTTPVTLSDGTLYYCSNLGFVAAVDALSGQIRWITEYDAIEMSQVSHFTDPPPRRVWWHNEPPLVSDGVVVATPLDSEYAAAFDRHTGKMLWVFHGERLWPGDCRRLMGIRGGKIILAGSGGAAALDIRGGDLLWRTPPSYEERACAGRGALTEDRLHFELEGRFMAVDTESGRIVDDFDKPAGSLDEESEPAGPMNLFLMGDVAAFATSETVGVCFNAPGMLERALARIDTARRTGSDAELLWDLLFVGDMYRLENDLEKAAGFYKKALAMGRDVGPSGLKRIRTGLYGVCLEKGLLAMRQGRFDEAARELRSAAESAPGPTQFVRASVELAFLYFETDDDDALADVLRSIDREARDRVFDFEGRFDLGRCRAGFFTALAGYKNLLEKGNAPSVLASLRGILENYPEETYGGKKAWDWSAGEIAALVRKEGRSIYEPFETEAKAEFAKALSARNPDKLGSVARRFPNSEVGGRAVLEQARYILAEGRPADAYRVLSELLSRETGEEILSHAYFLMACALREGGNDQAARFLFMKVRGDYASVPAFGKEGTTYGELIPHEGEISRERTAPNLPQGTFVEKERLFASPFVEMPEPSGPLPPGMKNKVLLRLTSPERILLYDYVEDAVVWEDRGRPAARGDIRHFLVAGEVLVLCFDRFSVGFDIASGRRCWEREFHGLLVDVGSSNGLLGMVVATFEGDRDDTMTAECVNPVTGSVLWRKRIEKCRDVQIVPAIDSFAVIVNSRSLLVLDPLSGAERVRLPLDVTFASPFLFESPQGLLLLRIGRRSPHSGLRRNLLLAVDSRTGKEVWTCPLGSRTLLPASAVKIPDGLLALSGSLRGNRRRMTLLVLDSKTGQVEKSIELAPSEWIFCGGHVFPSRTVFVRPYRFGREVPVSALELDTGEVRFEGMLLNILGRGGRHPTIQEGIVAGDGLIVVVDYDPARRDVDALRGRIFFVDGAGGDVTFSKDVLEPGGAGNILPGYRPLVVRLREGALLILADSRLICLREERK